ncbi:ThuA domain-containing protein [Robiginitomaculum antarcticum]|uniref:ThuA domain-containing protein n=1 Tax=Robiginitomaculum antarcticum TaxID=437507 RepID=UPI000360651A|nr:ThuA domain-containing protein [Robiginitomaculum antarcticum]
MGMKTFLICSVLALSLGACAVTVIDRDIVAFDTPPPKISEYMAEPSILVFSETQQWRHEEGIAGADLYMIETGRELGYGVFTTENSAVFNAQSLSRFNVVVFNNVTGDALTPDEEAAFKNWLEAGGAWVGLHGAGDSSHTDWPWYSQTLLGSTFTNHPADPQFQDARLENLNPQHPVMDGLPSEWVHNEEWYSFDAPAQNFGQIVLLGVDESTYSPVNRSYGNSNLIMDKDGKGPIAHPVAWARCVRAGRAVYSALGHQDTAYDMPYVRKLIANAILWTDKKTDPDGQGCFNAGG